MQNILQVKLFHGFTQKGFQIKTVRLRELNGYDEQYLIESTNENFPELVNRLLERVIYFEESLKKLNKRNFIQNLSIGDRTLLLITLHRLSFGDSISCTVGCPRCNESLMVDFSIESLVEDSRTKKSEDSFLTIGKSKIKVRPLAGKDQELILNNSYDRTLQERLIRASIISTKSGLEFITFSKEMIELVSAKLTEIDPLSDITLNLSCPKCELSFQTEFIPEDFIFEKIQENNKLLDREIHWLALSYHWHERDILLLPTSKRKRYVGLVNKTFAGEKI